MKKLVYVPFFLSAVAFAQSVPAGVRQFTPPGYRLEQARSADLNLDGRPDYAVVYQDQRPNSVGFRTVALILNLPDGWQMVGANNGIAYDPSSGGQQGDPFAGVLVGRGWIETSNTGGSGASGWTEDFRFNYDQHSKSWLLTKRTSTALSWNAPPKVDNLLSTCQRRDFSNMVCDQEGSYQKANVSASKAYFYMTPNLRMQRKAYLLRGDKVEVKLDYGAFLFASYTASDGRVSTGFLLKSDLSGIH